ncbi:uncharacterized protein MONBRDRAFT_8367 [Monosiga brevicollis MX1]|uniref:RecF/RecN/SMC N-terminal domain-containing protein n=1 Tax=Monosiga brevicollis TaxID=81824 RepID=A9UZV4_MONBE|nr:uncharacterized protein MONBRDRAFT_8367 [Monosiga brevicollis MX1]EDQ89430.1 predicted protein [Monosiga brevicollis MX1]|eukprot:XP_001746006.1 hypothetical protein [Monosiga brevicollis MX1]
MEQYVSFSEQREALMRRKTDQDDGDKAIERLLMVLDNKKDEAIERTFKMVCKFFSDVFKELVPHGHGELVMQRSKGGDASQDGDESQETDASTRKRGKRPRINEFIGVAIRVNFTGRGEDTHFLQSLSGGQKSLVALALIFSIQKCDPAAFYLFDEIDQALDPAHRAAVARMIYKASREAQYITTTFRPELLVNCDKCYGVSFADKPVFWAFLIGHIVASVGMATALRYIEEVDEDDEFGIGTIHALFLAGQASVALALGLGLLCGLGARSNSTAPASNPSTSLPALAPLDAITNSAFNTLPPPPPAADLTSLLEAPLPPETHIAIMYLDHGVAMPLEPETLVNTKPMLESPLPLAVAITTLTHSPPEPSSTSNQGSALWHKLFVVGAAAGMCQNLGQQGYLLMSMSGGAVSLLGPLSSMYKVIPMLFAILVLRHYPNRQQVLGMLLSVAAIAFFALADTGEFDLQNPVDIGYFFLCVMGWGCGSSLLQWFCNLPLRLQLLQFTVIVAGFVATGAIAVATVYRDLDLSRWSTVHTLSLLAGVGGASANLSYVFMARAARSYSAIVAPMASLSIVLTICVGALCLHEHIALLQAIGMAAMLLGVVLMGLPNRALHLLRQLWTGVGPKQPPVAPPTAAAVPEVIVVPLTELPLSPAPVH